MVFSSYIFLFVFLPITCAVYFVLPFKAKNIWLLLSSLAFYSWNNPRYTLILLASIIINWGSGLIMCRVKARKNVLVISVILNIGILLYYKYANFIVDNLSVFYPALGESWNRIALPLGISFFTFQGMSYVIDVYRSDCDALRNPLDVGLYVSLFPQLVAGPIVRFKSVAREIQCRTSSLADIGYGFRRFVYGLSKKVLLADTFGLIADEIFASPASWNIGSCWIGIIAYTLQIYFDFSGYSDMAIGLGRIFGFHFSENFNYPYTATSITDFWRKWHISLSSWFRDYVYIPCGGSRVPLMRHIFNIMLVWLLTGIWHGANWTFILWGIYYGVLLLIEKFILNKFLTKIPRLIRWGMTIVLVMIGWVIFRSDTLTLALKYLETMFVPVFDYTSRTIFMRRLVNYRSFWIAGIVGIFPIKVIFDKIKQNVSGNIIIGIIENVYLTALFVASILFIIARNYNAFIYFMF